MGAKRKASIAGGLTIQWWAMRDVACGFAARFRFGPAALACCAGKRFAFPQLRTLAGSNPMHLAQKRKASITGGLTNQWWAMRDVACGFAARFRFGPAALACCAGKRFAFPQLRTLAGSNPMHLAQKRKASITGGLTNQWWAMRDVACGFAARFRFVASLLACFAGKRFAFPQLRTLPGSNPMCWAQKERPPSLEA